jgi:cobyrinic acid a,c-diamide synthase
MEKQNMPRLLLAGAHSGSGKTTVMLGLLAAFQAQGLSLASYKCGPDYIDPMFHSQVLGLPTRNLDTFFTGREKIRELFARGGAAGAQLSLIEGVMGYYDGAGLGTTQGSSYELAEALECPVVLLIDGSGMSLSAVAYLQGFMEFRKPSHIVGVIFNRMSETVYQAIRPIVEALGIRPCGYVPKLSGMELPARHLGLVMPGELADMQTYLRDLGEHISHTVELDTLRTLAGAAPPMTWETVEKPKLPGKLRISVARDEAFCFLYEDNLRYLREIGGEITFFSPLHDTQVPEDTDVLLLPGGYPELYARGLSENEAMRKSVRKVLEQGAYVLAECGGFLYLNEFLEDLEGYDHPMVGWLQARAWQTKKLVHFGYIELTPAEGGSGIRGHEFHYFDSSDNGSDFVAEKPFRNVHWPCMHAEGGLVGFPHLYYESAPDFLAERLGRWMLEKNCEGINDD